MSFKNLNSFGSSCAVLVCDSLSDISEFESGSAEMTQFKARTLDLSIL